VAAPLLLLGLLFAPETGSYGHVYSLFWDKLRFLLEKPADPTLLSMQSRLLWIEAFNSPSWTYCIESFAVHVLALVAGLIRLVVCKLRIAMTPARWLITGLGLGLLPLYAMIQRISVLVIFFAAVAAGVVAYRLSRRGLIVLCLLLVPTGVFLQRELARLTELTPMRRAVRSVTGWEAPWFVPLWTLDHRRLSRWVSLNLPADAVIAARSGYGPLLAVHAGRAISMHPKWEAAGIRAKVESYQAALYGSEDQLAAWCREQGVTHVLLDVGAVLDAGPEGDRYVVAATELSTQTAAFRLHFAPQQLKRFQPVYQDMTYRLHALVDAADPAASDALPHQPVFDLAAFGGQQPGATVFDDSHTKDFIAGLQGAASAFARGQALLQGGRPAEAVEVLRSALAVNPSLPGANGYIGLALIQAGRPQQGLISCRREVELAPGEALGWRLLGMGHRFLGDGEGAYRAWLEAQRLDPGDPTVKRYLAELTAAGAGR
jgi:tetratricopeptide (TPR) repeat protein